MLTFIKKFSNTLFWMGIAASPIIAGTALGFFAYMGLNGVLGIIAWSLLVIAGLVGGYFLAEYARKKKGGGAEFLSKLNEFND